MGTTPASRWGLGMAFFRIAGISGIHSDPALLPDAMTGDDDPFKPVAASSSPASNFIDAGAVASLGSGNLALASAMSHALIAADADTAAASGQIQPRLLAPQTSVQWTQQPSDNYPFSTAGMTPPQLVFQLAVGDFNGDGASDVLFVWENRGNVTNDHLALTLGNGDGTFQTPIQEPDWGRFHIRATRWPHDTCLRRQRQRRRRLPDR